MNANVLVPGDGSRFLGANQPVSHKQTNAGTKRQTPAQTLVNFLLDNLKAMAENDLVLNHGEYHHESDWISF